MSGGKGRSGGTRWTGTWLSGARAAGADLGYPGERLGLPDSGPGSVAGYGRRLVALFLDWAIALLIAGLVTKALGGGPQQRSLITLAIFGVMVWLLTAAAGMTIGKRMCGIRVVRANGGPRRSAGWVGRDKQLGRDKQVGFGWALARTLLLLVVIPALLWDRDHRGLHDRAADTVVVTI